MDQQQDFFVPSAELAEQISALHSREAKFGARIDVTPTMAPASALEPVSIPRLQESLSIRLKRLMGGLGRRALHEKREAVLITTGTKLTPEITTEFAKDLNIIKPGSFEAVSAGIAQELKAWLAACPGGTKEYGFGTVGFNEDEDVVFIPATLAEFKEGNEPERNKVLPLEEAINQIAAFLAADPAEIRKQLHIDDPEAHALWKRGRVESAWKPSFIMIEEIIRPAAQGRKVTGVVLEMYGRGNERSIPVLDRFTVARWIESGANEIRGAQLEPRL
ncbi:MAG: hypothetical protein WCT53_01260 [Candidatus Gracilibacteria bacterium]